MHIDQKDFLDKYNRVFEEIVFNLQERGYTQEEAVSMARSRNLMEAVKKPKKIEFDTRNTQIDKYPEHPDYMPPVTTRAAFNRHMSQAISPYVTSIAGKVASERNLAPPNEQAIQRVLEKVDWTKAAYELNGLGKKPTKNKLEKFIDTYIVDPIDTFISKYKFKKWWPLVTSLQTMYVIYNVLAAYSERFTAPAEIIGDADVHRLRRKATKKFVKMIGPKSRRLTRRGIWRYI